MTPVRRASAIVLTLAAAALAPTAQTDAHAATARGDARANVPHTRLHVHVTGCDRCSITLQQAVEGHLTVWTSKPHRVGSDHVTTFTLRTARTHGLSFVIRAPWEGNTGAVTNMVTRYRSQDVGDGVTIREARHGRRAEGCWAGTGQDSARLDFHVARVAARTLDGKPTQIPLAYATHSLRSWRPMVRTFKGTLGNQDAFWCAHP